MKNVNQNSVCQWANFIGNMEYGPVIFYFIHTNPNGSKELKTRFIDEGLTKDIIDCVKDRIEFQEEEVDFIINNIKKFKTLKTIKVLFHKIKQNPNLINTRLR